MSFESEGDYSSVAWDTGTTDYLKPEDLLDQVAEEPPSQDLTRSTISNIDDSMFSVCLYDLCDKFSKLPCTICDFIFNLL